MLPGTFWSGWFSHHPLWINAEKLAAVDVCDLTAVFLRQTFELWGSS